MRAIQSGVVLLVGLLMAGCTGDLATPSGSAVLTAPPSASPSPPPSPTASLAPSPGPTALPPGPPTIAWQRQAISSIPASALVGGMAFRPGETPLYVAAGVSDFGAAARSAGGNEHLGTVWTSADGRTWKSVAIETARMLWDVAYGHGRFVAVGDYSGQPSTTGVTLAAMTLGDQPGVWSSTDGRRWTPKTLASGSTVIRVVHGDAGFLAIGTDPECAQGCEEDYAETLTIHVSGDGLNWSSSPFSDGAITDVAALPGHGYTAVGSVHGACFGAVWHSDDGVAWRRVEGQDSDCLGIAWLAVTDEGYLGFGAMDSEEGSLALSLRTSQDGLSWTAPTLIAADGPEPRAFGLVGGTLVFAAGSSIWEVLPAETRLRGPVDGVTFSAFAGGIGLDVSEEGAFAMLPRPAQ